MTKFNKPLNEILIEDFLPSLKGDGTFTKQQFVDWLEEYYPGFADSTVTNWLTRLTTNSKTRLNWPIRKGKDDVLFKIGETNAFRLFDKSNDAPPIYLVTEYSFSRIMRRCGELGIPYSTVIESPRAVSEGWVGGKVQHRDGENGTVGWGDKKGFMSEKHTTPHNFEEMLNFLGIYYDSSTNQYHHQSRWDLLDPNSNNDEIQRPDYDDEAELAFTEREGRKYLRTHLFRERSSKCVSAFKRSLKSFECSLCGFDFEKIYGEIGRGFIEAHHIIPVATTGEREVKIEDYRAVCSNCHRMIHRIYPKVLTTFQGS